MRRKFSGVLICVVLILGFGVNAWANNATELLEIEAVQSYFSQALDAKQPGVIFSIFSDNAQQHFNGYMDVIGVVQIYVSTVQANAAFSSFHTEIHDITANDNKVIAHITHTAVCIDSTAPGFPQLFYLPSRVGPILLHGQTIQWEAMARFKFNKDIKIVEEWIVRDELSILLDSGTVTFTIP